MTRIVAYTDGGCRGNPGPGGWAFLAIDTSNGNALERAGGDTATTNNRMEMMAAIKALEAVKKPGQEVLIYSDSQYLIKCVSEWMQGWKAKGWRKKGGELKNIDLLKELDRLVALHRVTWRWVKGHAGNRGNERVDELTNLIMDRISTGDEATWESRTTWQD